MSQIVIPCFICRSFDCEPVIAENVSVYRDFLFDRHLTEWPRTGNETGKETGNETGNEIGNDPEVIQGDPNSDPDDPEMVQRSSNRSSTGQVMRLS